MMVTSLRLLVGVRLGPSLQDAVDDAEIKGFLC